MRIVKQLTETDLTTYIPIVANAYPGMKLVSQEEKEQYRQRLLKRSEEPTFRLYGLWTADDKLVGVMNFHDFTMKLRSTKTLVGGIGSVAVDLRHKKEKVARDMLRYFLHHYRSRGACLTALYPFRPDFYKQMGFGYGAKMNQYRLKPDSLPKGANKEGVSFLSETDGEAVSACYGRVLERTNGLMERSAADWARFWGDPAVYAIGCQTDRDLRGYITFTFQPGHTGHFLHNNILIREFVYETSEALLALLTFLHTQADQVDRIIFNTQDETFHHLLRDPRNGTGNVLPTVYHESNVQGVGIMYRVINTPRLFTVLADHNFGGQTCRLKLTVTDSFMPENEGSTIVQFAQGRPTLTPDAAYDVAVTLDVAEFSSLVMGVVGFRQLVNYGLAHISDDAWLETVHTLFYTEQKSWCLTMF
jgi:predicted acetyltransferase